MWTRIPPEVKNTYLNNTLFFITPEVNDTYLNNTCIHSCSSHQEWRIRIWTIHTLLFTTPGVKDMYLYAVVNNSRNKGYVSTWIYSMYYPLHCSFKEWRICIWIHYLDFIIHRVKCILCTRTYLCSLSKEWRIDSIKNLDIFALLCCSISSEWGYMHVPVQMYMIYRFHVFIRQRKKDIYQMKRSLFAKSFNCRLCLRRCKLMAFVVCSLTCTVFFGIVSVANLRFTADVPATVAENITL